MESVAFPFAWSGACVKHGSKARDTVTDAGQFLFSSFERSKEPDLGDLALSPYSIHPRGVGKNEVPCKIPTYDE